MVLGQDAREDVDDIVLEYGKTVKLLRKGSGKRDLARGELIPGSSTLEEYNIRVQCTVNGINSSLVQEGLLQTGDLSIFFRWEYDKEADGTSISPTITPKRDDRIVFLGREWFIKGDLVPATSEDDVVIGWDANLSMVSDDTWLIN